MVNALRGLALAELGLGLLALVWAVSSDTAISYRLDARSVVVALVLTGALTIVNFALFFWGRRFQFARYVYTFFDEEIFPVLREATAIDIVAIALIAGFSEELLFRGMLQPRMGIVASSVLFGVLHGPEYRLWPFAVWATLVGAGFGLMYRETDNLAIPMMVHAFYDALALAYIRVSAPTPPSS